MASPTLARQPDEPSSPSPSSERAPILHIPAEIATCICAHLPNNGIKNLRLTCSFFLATARLRLERVFLSPNPRNIEVFLAIADHETFRSQVVEIIWDDALLAEGAIDVHPRYRGPDRLDFALVNQSSTECQGPCPDWFAAFCDRNRQHNTEDQFDYVTPLHEHIEQSVQKEVSWKHYQTLLRQQRDVLNSESHVHALEAGLERFSALRKITITTAAHGRWLKPLYETPMIRAFPEGFNYPIPPGWPAIGPTFTWPLQWEDNGRDWLGFRIMMRALAQNKDSGKVTDVGIDAHHLETGLNGYFFNSAHADYWNFLVVLRRPNFRRLHLDLFVKRQGYWWQPPNHPPPIGFRTGLFRAALIGAARGHGFEHLSIRTDEDVANLNENIICLNNERRDQLYVSLWTVFPLGSLARAQHFCLSRFLVKQHDLLSLLAKLPETLQTIELSFLLFLEGSYKDMLLQIRDTMGWMDRDSRPKVSISLPLTIHKQGRAIWIDDEVDAFLYHGGETPFAEDPTPGSFKVRDGVGVVRDAFEEELSYKAGLVAR
ncbi:Fc.00g111490.m01.CDS01 [Cosmosporella sp. VM-42]